MTRSKQSSDGVRVVELAATGITGAYAGWLLARLGAQVTRVPAAGACSASSTSPVQLALLVLAEGKTAGPAHTSKTELDTLLKDCDILLSDDPALLESLVGSPETLQARFPRLIVGLASTFGLSGPYAGLPGTALDAQAISGVAWSLGEPGRAPLSLPPGVTEHQGGAMLAAGCLLALSVRDARGSGRVVDVSLTEVLASYVAGNCRLYIHHGLQWHRSGSRASGSGGAYPYVILPCKDGEVCICGRTREEWMRLVQVMGNPDWANEPRYQDLRAMGKQYPDEVDALMLPWLARHTMAELEAVALKNNLIVSPIRGFADVLRTRHFSDSGFLVDTRLQGQMVKSPSLPFRVTQSRFPTAADKASGLLAVTGAVSSNPVERPDALPLAGMRVLDFGWVWSAPWVGTLLGELGAQVIKVEHSLRPDNLRLAGKVIRDGQIVPGPSKEMSLMYHQVNHGKLGITLNAKEPRAVALLKELAAKSDLVIENMSPGSMERTGLGYEDLRAVNPRLVMLAMSAAGQFGPLSTMRAYAPTMSSFVGMEALVGYSGEAPIGALNFGLGDPNASVHGLLAVLAALRHASATGEGCYIDLSQIEALLGTLRPYLLETQVRGRQSPTAGSRHPDMAPHGIYPAIETDAWLTIAVQGDAQWQALGKLAGDQGWALRSEYKTTDGRLADVAALDDALARWTESQPRDALVARLRSAGIASSPVLSIQELWQDPHFAARGVKQPVEVPFYGSEDLFRGPWRFSDFSPQVTACGPTLGQHNDKVFGELLGLSGEEIAELKQSGVIA